VGGEVYPGWEEYYLPTMVPTYPPRVYTTLYTPGYTIVHTVSVLVNGAATCSVP